jgi:hypothetical protein
LKRSYLVAGVFIILASTFLIEYYTNMRFPTQEYPLAAVPELAIGEIHTFSYAKALDPVGTYSYTITGKEGGLYTMVSTTDVSFEGQSILLESTFVFDEQYRPEEYHLTVEQAGDLNEIHVTFTGGDVVATVLLQNETVTLSDEFPTSAFMAENNMPGIWEILLISADLEMGSRYSAEVYIPQGGTMFDLEFYVQNNPQTITIDGEQLTCMVVQETSLDLRFYLHEGKLVQMRNDDQDLTFTRIN